MPRIYIRRLNGKWEARWTMEPGQITSKCVCEDLSVVFNYILELDKKFKEPGFLESIHQFPLR